MHFEANEDQATFLSVLDQMTTSEDAGWKTSADWMRFDWSAQLDGMLEENGFYDCAAEETLGPLAAANMIYRLNRLPVTVECAASSMLRPHFAPDLPRPIAVIEGNPDQAVRFLPVAKSVIAIGDDGVRTAVLGNHASETVESLFAYPMGRLADAAMEWTVHDTDLQALRNGWRVAVGAEIAGSLKGGLEAVLAYVRDRRQFGRSLGSFQAVQHRLAEAAVTIEAAYLLILKAAQSGDGIDSALALGYVQDASNRIAYDFHQFMGAMGLTLEHPLHRWTYRVRLLKSSLGGGPENLKRAADRRWS